MEEINVRRVSSSKPESPKDTQTQQPTSPKQNREKLLLTLIVLLIAIAGVLGYLWWQEKAKTKVVEYTQAPAATPSKTLKTVTKEPTTIDCGNKKIYASKLLGLAFCYPSTWGETTKKDAKLSSKDTGTRILISFSGKPEGYVGGASADWTTTIGRDGTCSDPTNQKPDFGSFSTTWKTEGSGMAITSGSRGVAKINGKYLISEYTDDTLTNGVCLSGVAVISGTVFKYVSASYFVAFGEGITTPKAHIDNENTLIPETDRTAFKDLVASIEKF